MYFIDRLDLNKSCSYKYKKLNGNLTISSNRDMSKECEAYRVRTYMQ